MSDSKNNKPVTMLEIFLIQMILGMVFVILPIIVVKFTLAWQANRD